LPTVPQAPNFRLSSAIKPININGKVAPLAVPSAVNASVARQSTKADQPRSRSSSRLLATNLHAHGDATPVQAAYDLRAG
jgi:hypothetical protein